MIRGGVQSVMLMVVLGSVATCALMVTTVLGSSDEDFRRNFLDDKYDKTFTNNNQTKVTRSFSSTDTTILLPPDSAADFTD